MSLVQQAKIFLGNQSRDLALNAFISRSRESADVLRAAQNADERRRDGRSLSAIDGRLIAIKDNIATKEQPMTCGSKILRTYTSPYEATVIEKLGNAGAILAGKTNLDEFGMGSYSTNSAFGDICNHLRVASGPLSAGGSSGGSAVAVASGQCWAALGTDTGGSVRLPASYCGVVGFKPSYGEVSRYGVVAYANSLDTVGILAPNTQVARDVFETIRGHDKNDPTSLSPSSRTRIQQLASGRKSRTFLRIGIPLEFNIAELQPAVRAAWLVTIQRLMSLGHSVQFVSLPSTRLALSAYYILAPAEASSNLAKYDGVRYGSPSAHTRMPGDVLFAATRSEGLGSEVRRRILLGSYSLSATAIDNYFLKAQRVRRLVQQDFNRVFALRNPLLDATDEGTNAGVDVLLSPTTPSLPPSLTSLGERSPVDAYRDDVLTVPASLAGIPALTVPVPCSSDETWSEVKNEITVGLQLTAQYGDDEMVFHAGQIIERLNA